MGKRGGYSRPQNTPLHHGDPLVARLLLLCRLEPDAAASVGFWRSGSSSSSSSFSGPRCRSSPRWGAGAGAKVLDGREVACMLLMTRLKSPSCCPKKLHRDKTKQECSPLYTPLQSGMRDGLRCWEFDQLLDYFSPRV
jgi:hypothetical protein